jgi:hypothetical protein
MVGTVNFQGMWSLGRTGLLRAHKRLKGLLFLLRLLKFCKRQVRNIRRKSYRHSFSTGSVCNGLLVCTNIDAS